MPFAQFTLAEGVSRCHKSQLDDSGFAKGGGGVKLGAPVHKKLRFWTIYSGSPQVAIGQGDESSARVVAIQLPGCFWRY